MLIWLNGAHGAGKTTVAGGMLKLCPGAQLIDPEQIGFMLRKTWPAPLPDDFKDMPVWRELTRALLRAAASETHGPIIVPMTLTDPRHFDEIVGTLREGRIAIRHFTLMASPEALRRRLARRLDWPSSRRWALARANIAAEALAHDRFAVHIETENAKPDEIARQVLQAAGIG